MRSEILTKLTELLKEEDFKKVSSEIRELVKEHKTLLSKEKGEEKSLDEELTDEELKQNIENKKLDDAIYDLIGEFKANQKEEREKRLAEQKKNFELKKQILEEFKTLVTDEENIGIAFNKRKEIQDKWREIGSVPQDKFEDIQTEYSRLNDEFSYNINLYKAIKDHDLKKNYSLKNQIIFELEELKKEASIKKVQDSLNLLRSKWDEIGPTFKEEWEKLKDTYWSQIDETRARINNFYKEQRDKLEGNLKIKEELIVKAKEIGSQSYDSIKSWKSSTEKILNIQEEWKKTGPVSKEKNKEIWEEFRTIFDEYFDKKKLFFGEVKEAVNLNVKRKKQLLEKANELKVSDLWSETSREIVGLQKRWKDIGHAGKVEQKLWSDFRNACNHFFDKKKEYLSTKDDVEAKNLTLKEELVKTIEKFDPVKEGKEAINKLKEFSSQFAEIGNVPFKVKDKIYKSYKDTLDKHYQSLKIDKQGRDKIFFKDKLEGFLGKSNAGKLFDQEKDKLKKHLTRITAEIQQYENNIGFFGNSSSSNPVIAGIMKKIEKAKQEIENIKEKIKVINQNSKKEA
jgi:hypothetical protein